MKTLLDSSVPRLGFGLMRLKELQNGEIDMELAKKLVDDFMAKGFRYFDAAYSYLDGRCEGVFKSAVVDRYPRDSYYIATKLPLWGISTKEECIERVNTSLSRLGSGYVDFWLLHSLREETLEKAEEIGAWELMKELKSTGKAKHIGFSYHDSPEKLDAYLDRHPEAEFVQLQINYLDWESKNVRARECYEVVRKHGLPVIIMEPIKGGNLATGNKEIQALFGDATPASLALRWVAEKEGVMMILSGMNDEAQVAENTDVMASPIPLTEKEHAALDRAAEIMNSAPRYGCTGCRYCVEGCPAGILIPRIIDFYNDSITYQNYAQTKAGFLRYYTKGMPSACIGCGQCESVCPQHLPVPEIMEKAAALLKD